MEDLYKFLTIYPPKQYCDEFYYCSLDSDYFGLDFDCSDCDLYSEFLEIAQNEKQGS